MAKKNQKRPKSVIDAAREKLAGARFRQLNELLYTSNSKKASEYFSKHSGDFKAYHDGWRIQQDKGWPIRPTDIISDIIEKRHRPDCNDKPVQVADMGCGEALIYKRFLKDPLVTVHSFDLVSCDKSIVIACDISRVPLEDHSVDYVIFSLSLMNTNYGDSLVEAARILRPGGTLLIAEIESRFDDQITAAFVLALKWLGFSLKRRTNSHAVFILFECEYTKKVDVKNVQKCPWPSLKPCVYKRR